MLSSSSSSSEDSISKYSLTQKKTITQAEIDAAFEKEQLEQQLFHHMQEAADASAAYNELLASHEGLKRAKKRRVVFIDLTAQEDLKEELERERARASELESDYDQAASRLVELGAELDYKRHSIQVWHLSLIHISEPTRPY